MRMFTISHVVLLGLVVGCAQTAIPQLDAQLVQVFMIAQDLEQAQPGAIDDTDTDTSDPDKPGEACMCLADPNYPCECRENPAACAHNPKCSRNARQTAPVDRDAVIADMDLASQLEARKQAEVRACVETYLQSLAIAPSPQAAEEEAAPAAIAQAPIIAGADPYTVWKQNLPPITLVVCTQPGCGPCKTAAVRVIAPLVKEGWHVVYIDITHSEAIAAALGVLSTPTFIGFRDGVEVGRCGLPQADPTKLDAQRRPLPAPAMEHTWTTIRGWYEPDAKPLTGQQLLPTAPPST